MFEPTKKKSMRCCAPDTRQGTIRRQVPSRDRQLAQIPELRLRRYRSPVICFRVELHPEAEPTRHSGADSLTAKALSAPCGGRCSRWDRGWSGNGKSGGNRRAILPSARSESVAELVPA